MDEFEKKIEKMLQDTVKGLATKAEMTKAIDEEVAKKIAEDEHVKETQTAVEELKAANDSLANQVKQLQRLSLSSSSSWPHSYKERAVWQNPEQAKIFGLFILATAGGREQAQKLLEDQGVELAWITGEKAMGEGTLTGGGAVVPTEFIPTLIALQEQYGVYRKNAQVYPMASDRAVAPKLSSGLTVYCPGEGTAITPSDLALKTVGLTAKMWCTLTSISIQLDEDAAIAIGEIVGRQIAWAFAKKEDEIGFLGDGTSTYFGHTGIAGALRAVHATIANIKSLHVATTKVYSTMVMADFEGTLSILPEYADDGDTKWYCSRLFYYSVMVRLAMAAGGANATEVLSGAGIKEKTFLSYPVEFTQAMPKTAAANQIAALLANLRMGAYLGDRRMMAIDRSAEVYFANAQIGIRGTQRVAVTAHGVGDTTNAGPICGLILSS